MLVGLPCLEEGIDTDPCVEKKYTEIITLIKEAEESNDTTEVGYLAKTLMKLIKENTMDEDLIVNEVAYNSALNNLMIQHLIKLLIIKYFYIIFKIKYL